MGHIRIQANTRRYWCDYSEAEYEPTREYGEQQIESSASETSEEKEIWRRVLMQEKNIKLKKSWKWIRGLVRAEGHDYDSFLKVTKKWLQMKNGDRVKRIVMIMKNEPKTISVKIQKW